MALDFTRASAQHLSAAAAAISAAPCTLACWFKPDDITGQHLLLSVMDDGSGTVDGFYIQAVGNAAGDPVRASTAAGGSFGEAATTTGFSANVWQHACGVFTSATSRAAFLNGAGKGTNTTSRTPSGLARTMISRYNTGASNVYSDAAIAEAAIWDTDLTDAEVAILATGISPLLVRPENLVFYAPLLGNNSPESDIVGGLALTYSGSPTKVDGPRIFRPSAQIIQFPTTNVGSNNTISVPVGNLTLTGLAPTVLNGANQVVNVPTGSLVLTGHNPTVISTANQTVAVPAGSLIITGYEPTVRVGADQIVAVPAGALNLTGFAPNVVTTSNQFINVPIGTLVLTGYAPTVLGGEISNRGSRSWTESERRLNERLRRLALQQARWEDDEEALAILLASIIRR